MTHPSHHGRARLLWTIAGLALLLGLIAAYLWRAAGFQPYRRTDYLLGTLIEITAYGSRARSGTDAAFAAMREIERVSDPRRRESDLCRLAQEAGRRPVRVSRHTLAMLRLGREWWARSDGAFDITVAPVVRAWGFAPGGTPHLPSPPAIEAALKLVSMGDLVLDEKAGTAFLRRPGMAVDLGGMAKGYAVDQAYEALRRAGVARALIDGGGSSIRVLGRPPRDSWRIGIAHPRPHGERLLAVLRLEPGQAVGTSADNQRYFLLDNRRYAHLIDPRTGYPAGGTILFSVVARNAVLADILSTACFVRGPSAGLALARAAKADGLVYPPDRQAGKTPGLRVESISP